MRENVVRGCSTACWGMFYCPGKQYVVTMCSISPGIRIYCILPALSIYCTLSLWRHTLIMANNTFYYWTLPQPLYNQIYFLSSMSELWQIWEQAYGREAACFLDNTPEEVSIWDRDAICVCCAWEKHLTFSWWSTLTCSCRNAENWWKKGSRLILECIRRILINFIPLV